MRWIGRILLTVLTLAVLVVVGLFFIPSERIAAIASDRFKQATGRDLSINGDIRPTIYPSLGVRIADVAVANAGWAGDAPMITADGLSVGVALGALIDGRVQVREMTLIRPDIRLMRAKDGRANWEFDTAAASEPAPAGETSGSGAPAAVSVDLAQISDGRVSFEDRASGQSYALDAIDATLRLPDPSGAAELALSARMNGQKIAAETTIQSFMSFLAGDVRGLDAKASVGGSDIRFDGRAGLSPLAADGALNAGLSDMDALFAALDQIAPELPRGLGQKVDVVAQFTLAPEGSVHLRGAEIALDQNRLTGDADLYFEDVPKLRARLSGGVMDLSALDPGGSGQGGSGAEGTGGWSKDRIDASALSALDGEVAIQLDGVNLGSAQIGPSDVVMRLNRSRLVLDLRRIAAYSGTVAGEFVINNRSGLSVGGNLNLADIALQPLLQGFADYDRLVGRGDLSVSFLGVGQSVDAIMNSLKGQGQFAVGKGELLGLDLAGMLRNLDASYRGIGQKTIFDSITASFAMENGVLSNADLDFLAPVLKAAGAGKIGLGGQTLDYRVTPSAFTGEDGLGGISVPVLITGTWANPKFRPDLEGLIDQNLAEEKAKLEAEAKARLEAARQRAEEAAKAKVAEELGVDAETLTDTESLEDAVKDKVEGEMKTLLGLD